MRKLLLLIVLLMIGLCISFIIVLLISRQRASTDYLLFQNKPLTLVTVTSGIVITPTPTPPYDIIRKANISEIRTALELYRSINYQYPNTLKELTKEYLPITRLDPVHNSEYFYEVSPTNLDYSLSAKLDDGSTYTTHAPNPPNLLK